MKNNKGFTLLEVMAVAVIVGIIMWGATTQLLQHLKVSKDINTKLEATIAEGIALKQQLDAYFASNPDKKVVINSSCTQVDGDYYAKKIDSETARVYTDSGCNSSLGTLNKTSNSSWVNDASNSLWILYVYDGELKMLVFKLNIFN